MKTETQNSKKKSIQPGFTLVEVIVSIAIFSLIVYGIVFLVSNIFSSTQGQVNLLADTDQARKTALNIMNELRNCQTSSTGAYPLATVDDQTLMFYSNIDTDSYIERIRYYVQSDKLYKGVLKPSGNPLVYNPVNEQSIVVQNDLANGTSPVFYYYNSNYDGTTDNFLTQPVNITAVRHVKLDLRIFNKAGVLNNNYYSVVASASIRNLKSNLGDPGQPDYTYNLTTVISPESSGSVSVSPAGPVYDEQTLVNLTAYANLGYVFDSWTGDVTSPTSSATTIVMNSNKSITANFIAVPQTLTGSISSKNGSLGSRRWTLRITNPNSYTVNAVNLYGFSLTQTAGPTCSPTLTSPGAFPVLVGNIGAGSSRTYQVTINFSGCNSSTRFTANFTFAGNNGADWGSATITNQPY